MTPISIQRFFIYKFFSNLIFYVPILLIFLNLRLDSASVVALLIAVYTVATTLTEVPTGIVADMIGHKLTLVIGTGCSIFATLIFIAGDNFLFYCLAQIFVALAISFRSGTEAAYLYSIAGSHDKYALFESRASSINYIALGISSILGSFLYIHHYLLPFLVTLLLSVFALIASFRLFPSQQSERRPSPLQILYKSGLNFKKQQGLFYIILLFAMLLTATGFIYWVFQLFLSEISFPLSLYGLIFSLGFVASAIGAWISEKINSLITPRLALPITIFLILICLLCMGLLKSIWAASILFLTQLLTGYLLPSLRLIIQIHVDENTRATMLSFESILQRAFLAGTVLIFGFINTLYPINLTFIFIGVLICFMVVPLYILSTNVGFRNIGDKKDREQ